MSRIANNPIDIPSQVEVSVDGSRFTAKGKNGVLSHALHDLVRLEREENQLKTVPANKTRQAKAIAGTTRVLLQNIITGVSEGFERRLEINGVGYRAQMQGKKLNLLLGFSHAVDFPVPEGITIETPSQTEVVIKGADKQKVGQVAADLRSWRPPEPYKGKGVRYSDERVVRKEAKKS